MRHSLIPLLVLACATAACAPTGPLTRPSGPTLPAPDTCNATRYSATIGQPVTVLENQLHIGQVRILRPNTPMTMDLRPNRLNFHVNAEGKIERLSCV